MEVASNQSLSLVVTDSSIIGEARRAAATLADRAGLGPKAKDDVAVVVTEAVNNILKHAKTGEILLQLSATSRDVELLALDRGPGMADPSRCMQDGYSTGGTAGIGLGAIARLSTQFELFSAPGLGTALFCRFAAAQRGGEAGTPPRAVNIGALNIAKRGESVCGDAWAVASADDRTTVMIADGLGHGPVAADASREAVRIFAEHASEPPDRLFPLMHDALRKTRGAAVAVARLDHAGRSITFAGVGNIAGLVVGRDGSQKSMVSHNGTVGFEMRRVHAFDYAWPVGATVILYSDGLTSQLRLDRYNGLLSRHPLLTAGVIYRDFSRHRDDVTAVVLA